ncbi:hypothetical protein BU17DRAFT_68344 [Hysterangium stoloniferum]|nr:hypothetical protein BU17DRAFT_68344 [Hysterangium stoloniferum]
MAPVVISLSATVSRIHEDLQTPFGTAIIQHRPPHSFTGNVSTNREESANVWAKAADGSAAAEGPTAASRAAEFAAAALRRDLREAGRKKGCRDVRETIHDGGGSLGAVVILERVSVWFLISANATAWLAEIRLDGSDMLRKGAGRYGWPSVRDIYRCVEIHLKLPAMLVTMSSRPTAERKQRVMNVNSSHSIRGLPKEKDRAGVKRPPEKLCYGGTKFRVSYVRGRDFRRVDRCQAAVMVDDGMSDRTQWKKSGWSDTAIGRVPG